MPVSAAVEIAAGGVGCRPAFARAVATVESSGGRHLRRFEAHLFRRATGQKARSYAAARAIDPEAAARSCSTGMFQVLGRYYQPLGYDSATAMMDVLMDAANTRAQAQSFIDYCQTVDPRAGAAARAGDVEAFALAYNGPKALERGYHVKLRRAIGRAGGTVPVVLRLGADGPEVIRLQLALRVTPDGHFGTETEAAVRAFQRERGLVVDGIVGEKTWTAIGERPARPAPSSAERVDAALRSAPKRILAVIAAITGALGHLAALPVSLLSGLRARLAALPDLPYREAASLAALLLAALLLWRALKPERKPFHDPYRSERRPPDDPHAQRRDGDGQAERQTAGGGGGRSVVLRRREEPDRPANLAGRDRYRNDRAAIRELFGR